MRTSTRRIVHVALVTALLTAAGAASAATDAQSCRASIDKAAGTLLDCRLRAESTFATKGDTAKRTSALDKCAATFAKSFGRALAAFGAGDCPSTPESAFDDDLTRCSDDTVAAARGGELPAECGDGVVDATGEQCDGTDLGGDTCASLGFASGTLGCTSACRFDTGTCTMAALPATGQTTCWSAAGAQIACAGSGQDAETRAGAALAFTDNGDGTVTDGVTGLTWEKKDDAAGIHDKDTLLTWADAVAQVAALNTAAFAGHADWRVPNMAELTSILDLDAFAPALPAAFNGGCSAGCASTACSCSAGRVWSSTSYVGSTAFTWTVQPYAGETTLVRKTDTASVRAVRGGR